MEETTNGFRGEYHFLSNFSFLEKPIYDTFGIAYPTTEHYYQAMKVEPIYYNAYKLRKAIAEHPLKGLKDFVRKLVRAVPYNWNEYRVEVMKEALAFKFSSSNPLLRQKLLDTKNLRLVEYNYWHDTFWGVDRDTWEGGNMLGELLMNLRMRIKDEEE